MRFIKYLLCCLLLVATQANAHWWGKPRAVTMWWLFYNNPDACLTNPTGPERCGPVDVYGQAFLDSLAAGAPEPSLISPNTAAGLGVVYATGGVTDRQGRITLVASAYLSSDEPNTELSFEGDTVVDPLGLKTAFENTGAEIHVVIRDHGKKIRGQRLVQITNFLEPNCSDPVLLFEGGKNLCQDIQFAVFAPSEEGEDVVLSFADLSPVKKAKARLIRNGDMVQMVVDTRIPRTKKRR